MTDTKRPGRPALDPQSRTPSASVHLKLAAADYDRIERIARQNGESVQDAIRRGVKRLHQ